METSDETPTSPVCGWNIGAVPALNAVMLSLDYLTHATQRPDEAHHSPRFLLNAALARELAAALQKHAELSESSGPPGSGLPRH